PVPTKDCYPRRGVFASSVEPSETPLLETPKDAPAYREFQKELAARQAAVQEFIEQTGKDLARERAAKGGEYLVALYDFKHRTNEIARNAFMNKRGLNPGIAAGWDGLLKSAGRKNNPVFAPWFGFYDLDPKAFSTK